MANKIQEAFEYVKADPGLKRATIQYLAEKRRKKTTVFWGLPVYKAAVAICTIAVLLLGAGAYSWFFTPVSYVSIDVNPSIELALNRLDRVVTATAYNEQGETLLERLSLTGKPYMRAIHLITESELLQQYLAADEELVFTVAADSSRETALKTGVEECCQHIGHGSRSVSVNLENVSVAHDNEMSVGKYAAFLKLSQYDASVTIDACKDMSMAEIHGQILAHEHGSGHGKETGQGCENGADTSMGQDTDTSVQMEEDASQQDAVSQESHHGHRLRHHGVHE